MTALTEQNTSGGPLAGIHIASMALNVPGPVAARQLGSLGARVTKIEPPAGDPLIQLAPQWYAALHHEQPVIRLDLRTDEGVDALHGILSGSDVLLTSQRPRSFRRLGLVWPELHARHPKVSHVAIVGHPPPHEDVPGHDVTYLAGAGLLDVPHMPRTLLVDLAGSERVVQTTLALILERERSGTVGCRHVVLSALAEEFSAPLRYGLTTDDGVLGGGSPAYRLYAARGGWLALGAVEGHFQRRLCLLLGITTLRIGDLERIFLERSSEEWDIWAREHDIPLRRVNVLQRAVPPIGGRET